MKMRRFKILTIRALMLFPMYRAYQMRRAISRLVDAMPVSRQAYKHLYLECVHVESTFVRATWHQLSDWKGGK